MKLIENWKDVALRGHSMWAFYASFVCLALPEALFYVADIDTNPRIWWCLGLGLFLYGMVFRLVDQGIDKKKPPSRKVRSPWFVSLVAIIAIFASDTLNAASQLPVANPVPVVQQVIATTDEEFLAVAVPYVGKWEGLRLVAYLDIVGVPTVCYGETKGVKLGDTYTQAQCDAMFSRELIDYRDRLRPSFTANTVAYRLPVHRDVAFTSLAYNVGVSAFGSSTAVKRLNAGDIAGSCEALTWWNRAGGRIVRGLFVRRADDHGLCMIGDVS